MKDNLIENKPFSYSSPMIIWWGSVLYLVPEIISTFIVSLTLAIKGIIIWGEHSPEQDLLVLLIAISASSILFFPLLKYALNTPTYVNLLRIMKVKPMGRKAVFYTIVFSLSIELVMWLLAKGFNIPTEPFIQEVISFTNSTNKMILVIISICFIAPILEEFYFRGWLMQSLMKTKLGKSGAIVISSALFSSLHLQYVHFASFLTIFSFGILIGIIRIKTNNLSYPIIIHILSNTYATISIFTFKS